MCVEVPVPGDCGDAHVDGNDDTAGHCVRDTRCGQVLEPRTGTLEIVVFMRVDDILAPD